MRILGLDAGSKRIGVALSDELFITAQGAETIQAKGLDSDVDTIRALIMKENVCEVVVGLPLNMNGTESAQTKEVLKFIEELRKRLSIPVKAWDERLTSIQADQILLEADMSRSKRRKLSDKVAAQLILQSYLDSRKKGEISA
jgi:putative Holliday junction resolvase